jgi:hypothetical protein
MTLDSFEKVIFDSARFLSSTKANTSLEIIIDELFERCLCVYASSVRCLTCFSPRSSISSRAACYALRALRWPRWTR